MLLPEKLRMRASQLLFPIGRMREELQRRGVGELIPRLFRRKTRVAKSMITKWWVLQEHKVDLVCLAGYMRLLSPWFVKQFPQRILNIHPSLLPAFPGLEAQEQAFAYGVKVSGCTVHFVDEEL